MRSEKINQFKIKAVFFRKGCRFNIGCPNYVDLFKLAEISDMTRIS